MQYSQEGNKRTLLSVMSPLSDKLVEARKRVAHLKEEVQKTQEAKLNGYNGIKGTLKDAPTPLHSALAVRKVLKGHFHKIYAIHWSQSKPTELLSAGQDGKLILWDTLQAVKKQVVALRSAWVMTCAIEPTMGNLVACGGLDNVCSIYNLSQAEGQITRTYRELTAHDGYISCCRFINEESIITSSGDKTCMLWDVEQAKCVQTFDEHEGDVMSVSILPHIDPNLFVSGSCDSLSKVWDVRTGKCSMTMRGHSADINSVCLSPDANSFATGSDDQSCRLFDMRSCAEVASFQSDKVQHGVTSISFSHSGRVLFAAYEDSNCLGWDLLEAGGSGNGSNGRHHYQLQGHENRVANIGVSSDGYALCTASWDSSLKIWM